MLLTGVLAPAFIGTTIFYHQNYLTTLHNWPPQLFAESLVVMALTTVGCALLTGAAIDRFGASWFCRIFLLPLSGACFVLAYSGPEGNIVPCHGFARNQLRHSATLFGSLWPEIYGLANLGAVRSVTVSAAVMATAAGPGLTGTLIDHGMDLPAQMMFFGLYCLLAAGAMTIASVSLRRRALRNGVELAKNLIARREADRIIRAGNQLPWLDSRHELAPVAGNHRRRLD